MTHDVNISICKNAALSRVHSVIGALRCNVRGFIYLFCCVSALAQNFPSA